MSGCSYGDICPNCGRSANFYTDRKPFEFTSIECLYCGFTVDPRVYYYSLEELNEARANQELKPLKKLPKQDKNIW